MSIIIRVLGIGIVAGVAVALSLHWALQAVRHFVGHR